MKLTHSELVKQMKVDRAAQFARNSDPAYRMSVLTEEIETNMLEHLDRLVSVAKSALNKLCIEARSSMNILSNDLTVGTHGIRPPLNS